MHFSASGPLRIGLVTPAWPGTRTPNGIASAVANIAAGLEQCGHEVTILAHAIDAPHDHPRVIRLPATRLNFIDKMRRRWNVDQWSENEIARRHAAAITLAQAQHGVEIVVMEETCGWVGDIRKHVAIPIVATLHGPWWLHRIAGSAADDVASARREAREAAGLRLVDGITAPSRDVLKQTDAIWGLPSCPRAVIPNPLPQARTPLHWDASLLDHVLFVGRFDHIKGGDLVIDTFARIAAVNPRCRLTFAGPDIGILRKNGSRLTLASLLATLPKSTQARITVTGKRSRDEITALRQQHGITIVASRYETFGGTLVEAMAVGSAVVCTRVGGCPENMLHERTGLLVPANDPEALAAACLRFMADPALAQRLGAAARQYVAENLSPDVIGQQLAAFLAPICRP